jgi:hypothetical protein
VTTMSSFIGFAEVAGAIVASMGLAMWLEWFCLRWLMRIMPGRLGAPQPNLAHAEISDDLETMASEPEPAKPEIPVAPPLRSTQQEIRLGS